MRWPDEIRDPTELLPPPVQVSDEEIEGALALMDTLTVDKLEGPDFQDRYTEAITQIIEAKREEKPLPETPEHEEPSQVLDLMAALQESVSKAKAARGEADAEVHELPKQKETAAKSLCGGAGMLASPGGAPRPPSPGLGQQPACVPLSAQCRGAGMFPGRGWL
ncbi:hypothetical protein [Streptomyces sp. NPDC001480]|uniref:hypothetical protein n=1 Tax=Streptomyces sp. NPDC001480 TaxID=3364577 RepID=UPI00369438CA